MVIEIAVREKIINWYKKGFSKNEIAKRVLEKRTSVHYTIKRFKETNSVKKGLGQVDLAA